MISNKRKFFICLLVALGSMALSGCKTVMPWEKAVYAEYHMHPERDPLEKSMSEHTYFTREASSGGAGIGGGGCGCN
jgi:hypothetical protein